MYIKYKNCVGLNLILSKILCFLTLSPFLFITQHSFANEETSSYVLSEIINSEEFYNSRLNDEERQWLKNHKTLRLGVDHAWAPFEYFDQNKKYSGAGLRRG